MSSIEVQNIRLGNRDEFALPVHSRKKKFSYQEVSFCIICFVLFAVTCSESVVSKVKGKERERVKREMQTLVGRRVLPV